MKKLMLIAAIVSVVGCSTKSAPEKHAWYFSQHRSVTLNGNFETKRGEVYRMNLPEFKKVYQQGEHDRAEGKTLQYATAYAGEIRKQAQVPHQEEGTFMNNKQDRWTEQAEYQDAVLWFDGLSATYLDGYNGVK